MLKRHIAQIAHEANRAYCATLGDDSQPEWGSAPAWQVASALDGVNAIRANPDLTPEQSHENWMKHKLDAGWRYGPVKDPVGKTHPCMVPYDMLPKEQRRKDAIFTSVVKALLDA